MIQVRASYGLLEPNGDDSGNFSPGMQILGGDALVSPPLIPLIFGVRYEQLTYDEGVNGKLNYSRVSALIGFRPLDSFVFAGAIATLGVAEDVEVTVGSVTSKPNAKTSLTLGGEGGVNLMGWIIGGEMGYFFGGVPGFDFNGPYFKLNLGYDF